MCGRRVEPMHCTERHCRERRHASRVKTSRWRSIAMNGPEEQKQRTETAQQGEPLSFEDAQLPEFEQALRRAMKRVELRAETSRKFLALAEEAERKRVAAGGGI